MPMLRGARCDWDPCKREEWSAYPRGYRYVDISVRSLDGHDLAKDRAVICSDECELEWRTRDLAERREVLLSEAP